MAHDTLIFNDVPGSVLYAKLRDDGGQVWNGTAMVPYVVTNWPTYAVAMPVADAAGDSAFTVPTTPTPLPAGSYSVDVRRQAGAAAAAGDTQVAVGAFEWDGIRFSAPEPSADPGLWFLRNRWTLTLVAGTNYRLRVYQDDGVTGGFSGLCQLDPTVGVTGFAPDATFTP